MPGDLGLCVDADHWSVSPVCRTGSVFIDLIQRLVSNPNTPSMSSYIIDDQMTLKQLNSGDLCEVAFIVNFCFCISFLLFVLSAKVMRLCLCACVCVDTWTKDTLCVCLGLNGFCVLTQLTVISTLITVCWSNLSSSIYSTRHKDLLKTLDGVTSPEVSIWCLHNFIFPSCYE